MRLFARIATIALAAAIFIGLTVEFEQFSQPTINRFGDVRESRRRPPEPRLSRLPQVFFQLVFNVVLALVGRYVLRLRL